jgi:hypothetical protein
LLERHVVLLRSSYKQSKWKPFAFGGVQKDLSRKHLFHHSTRSSWSMLNLITCLSTQALANSIRYTYSQSSLLECSHSWCGYTAQTCRSKCKISVLFLEFLNTTAYFLFKEILREDGPWWNTFCVIGTKLMLRCWDPLVNSSLTL